MRATVIYVLSQNLGRILGCIRSTHSIKDVTTGQHTFTQSQDNSLSLIIDLSGGKNNPLPLQHKLSVGTYGLSSICKCDFCGKTWPQFAMWIFMRWVERAPWRILPHSFSSSSGEREGGREGGPRVPWVRCPRRDGLDEAVWLSDFQGCQLLSVLLCLIWARCVRRRGHRLPISLLANRITPRLALVIKRA